MQKKLEVKYFNSIGSIKFGMTEEKIRNLFTNEPDYVSKGFLGRLNLRWSNLSIKLSDDLVEEISLEYDGFYEASINNINVFDDFYKANLDQTVGKSFQIHGFEVYLSIGVAFTGYLDGSEAKTITFFDKKLRPSWEALYKKANIRKDKGSE